MKKSMIVVAIMLGILMTVVPASAGSKWHFDIFVPVPPPPVIFPSGSSYDRCNGGYYNNSRYNNDYYNNRQMEEAGASDGYTDGYAGRRPNYRFRDVAYGDAYNPAWEKGKRDGLQEDRDGNADATYDYATGAERHYRQGGERYQNSYDLTYNTAESRQDSNDRWRR